MPVINTTSRTRAGGNFRGAWQVLRFNAHRYLAALLLLMLALAAWWFLPLPASGRVAMAASMGLVLFWSLAAPIVSHLVYDRSPLMQWQWLVEYLPAEEEPLRWVNVHSGFDDTSAVLRNVLDAAPLQVIDLFDPQITTERSLAAARWETAGDERTVPAAADKLPLPDRSADVVFLLLTAHEIRLQTARERLFDELHRVLRDRGRVVLVEHPRDLWNFAAFGPGVWHFLSLREWLRLARLSRLNLVARRRITPFVSVLVWEKHDEPGVASADCRTAAVTAGSG